MLRLKSNCSGDPYGMRADKLWQWLRKVWKAEAAATAVDTMADEVGDTEAGV